MYHIEVKGKHWENSHNWEAHFFLNQVNSKYWLENASLASRFFKVCTLTILNNNFKKPSNIETKNMAWTDKAGKF